MATQDYQQQPSFRRSSPSPELALGENYVQMRKSRMSSSPSPSNSPTPAIGACPELSRCVSTGSNISGLRSRSVGRPRDISGSSTESRESGDQAWKYNPRQSTGGLASMEKGKKRGYVRPQGTNFAKSAQSRESVLSLGSIAHLQYYFARTGLLDGKGGRLAKSKKGPLGELDLSSLNTTFLSPGDRDFASSNLSSPDFNSSYGNIMDSRIQEEPGPYDEDDEEAENFDWDSDPAQPEMLPPTVSTYKVRTRALTRPPTLSMLKASLDSALTEVSSTLASVKASETIPSAPPSPSRRRSESDNGEVRSENQGWYELQGMHILDVVTLAIRAARKYYTSHDQPSRLASIKSERRIRAELLSVMDVLKRMATRQFIGGIRSDECEVIAAWVEGVRELVRRDSELQEQEAEMRRGWKWLDDEEWPSAPVLSIKREICFLRSMAPGEDPSFLKEYETSDFLADPPRISAFLRDLQDGRKLVKLHNVMVRKSRRPFGGIPTWHEDTAKPYRMSDNLRYWIKAAELRWEVVLKIDVSRLVNASQEGDVEAVDPDVWLEFQREVWRWCGVVRREITGDIIGTNDSRRGSRG